MSSMRINIIPEEEVECAVCGVVGACNHFDRDLVAISKNRQGHVCRKCSGFVILAEARLADAGLTIPTDSILGGGL